MPTRQQASPAAPGHTVISPMFPTAAKEQKDAAKVSKVLENSGRPPSKAAAGLPQTSEGAHHSPEAKRTPHAPRSKAPRYTLTTPEGEQVALPQTLLRMLGDLAAILARGDGVAVMSYPREITTQQAATLLNVPHRYLLTLLDEGRLPFEKKGRQCRIPLEALLKFKEQRSRQRRQALREITRLSEEMGDYDHMKEPGRPAPVSGY